MNYSNTKTVQTSRFCKQYYERQVIYLVKNPTMLRARIGYFGCIVYVVGKERLWER